MAHPPNNPRIQPPETMPPPEDRIRPSDIASIFNVSLSIVYDWIASGYPVWRGGKTGSRWIASRAHAVAGVVKHQEQLAKVRTARAERAAARAPKERAINPTTGLPRKLHVRELIGVSEVARIMRTSRARVYALAYAGEITTIPRPGSAALAFRRTYIEELREKQEAELRGARSVEGAPE